MQIFISILAFFIVVFFLVITHELGHFLVARLLDVKVLCFSVGFGKKLWRVHDHRGTEYALSAIPVGGYVKMLDENEGDVPAGQLSFTFNRKHPLKKIMIILAGPLFNFISAILVLWIVFTIGVPGILPVIGKVDPGSVAFQVGFRPQQQIVAVNGHPTQSWHAVEETLIASRGKRIVFTIRPFNTEKKSVISSYLDRELILERDQDKWQNVDLLKEIGIFPVQPAIPAVVAAVDRGGPAAQAGLRTGDKVVRADDQTIDDFDELTRILCVNSHKPVRLKILRQGILLNVTVVPKPVQFSDGQRIGRIGIQSLPLKWPEHLIDIERYTPFQAIVPAIQRTYVLGVLTVKSLYRILAGQVFWRQIGGPVRVAQYASLSLDYGIISFLKLLALLSVGLGIINLFPFPVLDGGCVVYCLVEMVMHRSLNSSFQKWSNVVGACILICLMVLTVINDLFWL
jgi:regulator of sigma E protease